MLLNTLGTYEDPNKEESTINEDRNKEETPISLSLSHARLRRSAQRGDAD